MHHKGTLNFPSASYYEIGSILRTYGVMGAILLHTPLLPITSLQTTSPLFLPITTTQYLPYFIHTFEAISLHTARIHFEDITTKEEAQKLIGKKCYLNTLHKTQLPADSCLNFIGYEIICDNKKIGKIQQILPTPAHPLAQVFIQGKEVLLPLTTESILHVSSQKQELTLLLPDGLLAIYL